MVNNGLSDEARRENKVRQEVGQIEGETRAKLDDMRTKSRVQTSLTNAPPSVSPHPERAFNHIPEKDYPSSPFPE